MNEEKIKNRMAARMKYIASKQSGDFLEFEKKVFS
jgi:hypothetical protein